MKKITFLIMVTFITLLLNIPVINAAGNDIAIKSVELIEKSTNTVELENAKFEDLNVWFKLKFFELNDNAKYKIVIKNSSTEDYLVNNNSDEFTDETYIDYEFIYEDNDNIVKAGTEETMYVIVSYSKTVPDSDFVNNTYTNDNYMNISFSKDDNITNPNTNDSLIKLIILCVISVVAMALIIVLLIKCKKTFTSVIVLALLLPIIAQAAELFKINIHANVIIQKQAVVGTFNLCGRQYQFEEGMSIKEWLKTDYNTAGYYLYDEDGDVVGPSGFFITSTSNYDNDIENNAVYDCDSVAECVAPNSNILVTEDGTTKQAKDIKENDSIMYYDFETNTMKKGIVEKVYEHKDATNFIRYTLEDNTYIEATDYHPIYTKEGWKSYTNRNNYPKPVLGDQIKTNNGYKKLINIETYTGKDNFYDFKVKSEDGKEINNYFANGILVHSAY